MQRNSQSSYRKGLIVAVGVGATILAVSAFSRTPQRPTPPSPPPARTAQADPVARAEARVRRQPENVEAYHQLAIALMRVQRESGDPALHGRAEQALLQAQRLAPKDYQTRKLLAWVLAAQHRFDEAVELARDCARRNPQDYWNYGVIGDALTEQGDYPRAVAAVQKMVNLKPGSLSYARAAGLRQLHGDPEGALEIYGLALEATSGREKETRAWIRIQMGDTRFLTGDLDAAGTDYEAALQDVPSYYLAMGAQAQLLAARGKLPEAAAQYRAVLQGHERPDWRAALGDVYAAMGNAAQAETEYREVTDYLQRHLEDPTADATHQLAEFLADRGREPQRALALARKEAADAKDIKALDTLAWAYYHNGQYAEAQRVMQRARRLGTQDPKLLYHAGMIATRLPGQRAAAEKLLREALALNPNWHVLDAAGARDALKRLDAAAAPPPARPAPSPRPA